MITLNTSASSGLITRRRSVSVFRRHDVEQRDHLAAGGTVYSTKLWWLSSASSSMRTPVWRSTSTAAHDQNARCSSRPRSLAWRSRALAQILSDRAVPGHRPAKGFSSRGECPSGVQAIAAASRSAAAPAAVGHERQERGGPACAHGSAGPCVTCAARGPAARRYLLGAHRAGVCPRAHRAGSSTAHSMRSR